MNSNIFATNSLGLTPAEAAAFGGILGGMIAFISIIVLVWYILLVIAEWKILEKAGEKGWKSLIPIYNVYMLYKIVNMSGWFWAMFGLGILTSIVSSVSGYGPNITPEQISTYSFSTNPFLIILVIVTLILAIVVEIKYAYRTAKVFGKGIGYTLGILFLPNIFWLILGFGKAKYNKKHIQ